MIAPVRPGRAARRILWRRVASALLLVTAVLAGRRPAGASARHAALGSSETWRAESTFRSARVPRSSASPTATPGEAPEEASFRFSPGTCEQGPDFCALATPREWAPAEIDLVRAALDEIAAREIGRWITQRARRNGFVTLRRFAHAAQLNAEGRYAAQPMIVATTHTDADHEMRTIDLTDRFFDRASARDQFSGEPGYLLTTEILAHELVHAVDVGQRYSGTMEFGRVAKLGMPAIWQRDADRVNLERERLNGEGLYEAAWKASRSFGIVLLRGRLPSVQALDSYREAFAEFGAHLVLDPNARRRFEPRLLLFFQRTVSEAP
jgi:hypothetical protein